MLLGRKLFKTPMAITLTLILAISFMNSDLVSANNVSEVRITTTARVGNNGAITDGKEANVGRHKDDEHLNYARLYYKADLSEIANPIDSAILKINAKVQASGTLNIYKVRQEWDVDTINDLNRPLIDEEPFVTKSMSWSSSNYIDHEINITQYAKQLQADGDSIVNIMLDYVHTNSNEPDARLCVRGIPNTDYPYIEIVTEDSKPTFRDIQTVTVDKTITESGVIDKQSPDSNHYSSEDKIGTTTHNGVDYDRRVFYKTDLSGIAGKEIISAKLVINERCLKYGPRLIVLKVNQDWNKETISYNNSPYEGALPQNYASDPNYVANKFGAGYEETATEKELDITNYVKSLTAENSMANLMVYAIGENMGRSDLSHIKGLGSDTPPVIRVTYKDEVEYKTLTASKITGSWDVTGGSQSVPLRATPILGLYNGARLEKIAIGASKDIVGSGVVNADIDLTGMELGENHQLKMFVWGDMLGLNPILDTPGILPYQLD